MLHYNLCFLCLVFVRFVALFIPFQVDVTPCPAIWRRLRYRYIFLFFPCCVDLIFQPPLVRLSLFSFVSIVSTLIPQLDCSFFVLLDFFLYPLITARFLFLVVSSLSTLLWPSCLTSGLLVASLCWSISWS